jgi:hypothetical protein
VERFHLDWLAYVQDDHAMCFDVLVNLNARNTHTCRMRFSPRAVDVRV